jgi:nitrate/nitrite transport system substrate-binding protein
MSAGCRTRTVHHGCGCEHDISAGEALSGEESRIEQIVEESLLRSVVPHGPTRRAFLGAVGGAAAFTALGEIFPIGTAKALAMEASGALEKSKITVGYVPITCTVPLLLAHAMGDYQKEGLEVSLARTPGWAVVRDKLNNAEFDASHLVLAMPLTMTLGVGSQPTPTHVAAVQNTNGNAITLAMKHKERRDPKTWKGFRFGIPHEYSMHAMLLRYYVAEHGLDPDRDIELRVYPPPDSVANMASGNLDGMIFAEPWNQRAVFEGVGFLHLLTKDIFPNHPCCTLSVTSKFMSENPNSFGALFRAMVRASTFADARENRQKVADLLSPAAYLNQPKTVLEQVLLGRYADGLGNIIDAPDRIAFNPFPYQSTAIWLITQLKRWGMVPKDVNYKDLAAQVFLSTGAASRMRDMGLSVPEPGLRTHMALGKTFDPAKPDDYLDSFAIKRV